MTRVVLASASAGRLSVLRNAGLDPLTVVSGVDEDAVSAALGPQAPPPRVVERLAAAKAETVAAALDPATAHDAVVIGCDSLLELDGRLCGKPGSLGAARAQWEAAAGRAGRLHTGHCVLRVDAGAITGRAGGVGSTTVRFATPTAAELRSYLASGEPVGVAGGFTLDGLGGWFVDAIDGDPSNVIGLSLPLTRALLSRLGLSIADLWADRRAE